ncbi:MAG: hypothetical protein A3K19_29995 [Lentisphaerae bacterium RIFOXYB12_FULL_65_16]|nr:MAG: hypothetical protein A3K18_33605 [Lentisphaerae bacterium RIFOXYA12_64_32]OGV86557.1 MAG: hypothetical protein A3K19_29995 [Lentisphaerae bacterium RIFOXYB12_FULL_65_16]
MSKTRTGGFPVGFRRGGTAWQKDLNSLIAFARQAGLEFIDLNRDADTAGKTVAEAGFRLGSVDLPDWTGLASADKAKRDKAAAVNSQYIRACAALGTKCFFVAVMAEDAATPRAESYKYAVEGYGALAPALEQTGSWVVMEGWPGPTVFVTTPETYRAFLRDCPARMAVNYDPSHLIRMGIDPIRFLREFAPQVRHVHAKDTEVYPEAIYEFGYQTPALFAKGHGYGGHAWRYTIPGHGQMRWKEAFSILRDAGYQGGISIELEDENFNGTEAGEKEALTWSCRFLASC